jgi:hypothetical protein
VREGHAADLLRQLVGHEVVEEGLGAGAGDLVFGEGAHVLEAHRLVDVAGLPADDVEIVGAAEAPLLLRPLALLHGRVVLVEEHVRLVQVLLGEAVALRREPVGALPAVDGAEHGAQRLHAVVARGALEGAGGGALLVRVVHREHVGVGLLVLPAQVAAGGVGAEAAGVHAHHVDGRLAVDDPFGELPARPARRR